MKKITFLDCTNTQYNGDTIRTKPLGGIESTTVSLAEALAKKGYEVKVINQNNVRRQSILDTLRKKIRCAS
ncbi:MAG: hypothetical protein ACTHOO_07975, partial [Alcanivorax sp.]